MDYQLVLQFNVADVDRLDWLCEIQEDLATMLGAQHLVDGNDIEQGKMNIFIHTEKPIEAFEISKDAFYESDLKEMVAAYRNIDEEEYKVIWPKGSKKNFYL